MSTTVPTAYVTRIFTFGGAHVCPITGRNLRNHYVTITAPERDQCREFMLATFGREWAFEYGGIEDPRLDRYRDRMIEHVRLTVVDPGYDRVAGAEAAEAPAPVPPTVEGHAEFTGRASVPDMQTRPTLCSAEVEPGLVCGLPIYWDKGAHAWWHQNREDRFKHTATGPSVPPQNGGE